LVLKTVLIVSIFLILGLVIVGAGLVCILRKQEQRLTVNNMTLYLYKKISVIIIKLFFFFLDPKLHFYLKKPIFCYLQFLISTRMQEELVRYFFFLGWWRMIATSLVILVVAFFFFICRGGGGLAVVFIGSVYHVDKVG
jgi:hypothetical protein